MLPNVTLRQRTTIPRTVTGTNGTSGNDQNALVNAFISTDGSNSVYTQNGSGNIFRADDKFSFVYHVTDNLTVSLPFHIFTSAFGGEFDAGSQTGQGNSGQSFAAGFDPGVDILINKAGALSNVLIKFGQLDNMKSSRTGLAFKAIDASTQGPAYENPSLPYQKGFNVTGTLNGLTDFQFSYTRVDPVWLNTQPNLLNNDYANGFNSYLFTVVPNQFGYTQPGYPGPGGSATRTASFTAGNGPLTVVYLNGAAGGGLAIPGTVYVSSYDGTLYNSSGQIIGGGTAPAPGFAYDESLNAVVFSNPLPAGSTVTVTYVAQSNTNNNVAQRYQINGRINQKFRGLPGAELGLSFNRIYDFDDPQTSGALSVVSNAPVATYGLVSDTVFGLDAQLPLGFNLSGPGSVPVLFGEVAASKYSPDFRNVPAVTDTASVAGINLKFNKISGTVQYQSVGVNFMEGAPFHYYGNAPTTLAYWKLPYFPAFYGFGNQLGLNTQFDRQFLGTSGTSSTATNPALTYANPIFNPFVAGGPSWYSSFTPNTQGVSANANIPFTIGDLSFAGRISGSYLTELHANSIAAMQYGPAYESNVRETFAKVDGALNFTVPAFGQKLAAGLGLGYERLKRDDKTAFQYYPFDPTVGGNNAAAVAAATGVYPAGSAGAVTYTGGGSQVSWYPNYINVQHYTLNATASMPLTKGVVLSATYNQQNFGGFYQTLGQNMDEKKTFLIGSVTYTIPNTNSSIGLAVRNQQYKDNVLPTYNLNQNREDILYTIRF
jgi:hypothetical protein